jgi:hypothetical protein
MGVRGVGTGVESGAQATEASSQPTSRHDSPRTASTAPPCRLAHTSDDTRYSTGVEAR